MKLTPEQIAIINSSGDIKINAVAGSGKTTTVIEYAKARPAKSKILYLAFNKSVKMEAIKKFSVGGLQNVTVETAHSLAYKHVVFNHNYKVKAQGYKTNEIVELLNLQGDSSKLTKYVIANHINKFIAYFCNSDKPKVQELNYLETVTDPLAQNFVSTFYQYILAQTRLLLGKMNNGEIEITHDFYLKKFQLENPVLPYDYILFDEGQDASPAMLDVFFKQNATKVIVGDTHQQIYGWRFAVNSLEKANYKTFQLSTSFRFNQSIADLAMRILNYKKFFSEYEPMKISGNGNNLDKKTKAILARTNLGLLVKAIEFISDKKQKKQIYFEGNINSYTYADDGTSLYDVLNLENKNKHLIKDLLIKSMKNLVELEEYSKKTEDVQLGMMIEIVKEYGNKIPSLIKKIKDRHLDHDDKNQAEMIFSTVHRSKGMEYDVVQLAGDFISNEKLEKLKEGKNALEYNAAKINEEINLLYVAATRSKNSLHIPEKLMPINFPEAPNIHILMDFPEKEYEIANFPKNSEKKLSEEERYEEIRKTHKDAYKPWTEELDTELTNMFCEGINAKDMAKHFGRTLGAINSRVKRLELWEKYG